MMDLESIQFKHHLTYIFNVLFNLLLVLFENICVNELILLSGFEMHAVTLAKPSLQFLEIWIKQYLLKNSHSLIELIIFIVST